MKNKTRYFYFTVSFIHNVAFVGIIKVIMEILISLYHAKIRVK